MATSHQPLRSKADGPGLMLSAFVGSPFFFGIPVPAHVIDGVNAERRQNSLHYISEEAAHAVYAKSKECAAARKAAKKAAKEAKRKSLLFSLHCTVLRVCTVIFFSQLRRRSARPPPRRKWKYMTTRRLMRFPILSIWQIRL